MHRSAQFSAWLIATVACVLGAGCGEDRRAADEELAQACAKCDRYNALEGALCYARLAEARFEQGERAVAEVKLQVASQKLALALEERGATSDSGALGQEGAVQEELIEELIQFAKIEYRLRHPEDARARLKQAVQLADRLESSQARSHRIIQAALNQHGIQQTGDAVESLKLVEALAGVKSPPDKSDLLGSAAAAYHTIGRRGDSERLVQQALETARSLSSPGERAAALAALGQVLEGLDQRDDATVVFAEAQAAAESIEDKLKRAFALAEVGKRLIVAKRFAQGKKVMDEAQRLAKQFGVVDPPPRDLVRPVKQRAE